MIQLDNIDKEILSALSKDGRISAHQISKDLADMQLKITDRAVRQRIERLGKRKVIEGFTIVLNPKILAEKASRIILLKFARDAAPIQIEKLNRYLRNSSFCLSASRLRGGRGFDYICHLIFDRQQEFDLEFNSLLDTFRELISDHTVCESEIVKTATYQFSIDHVMEARRKSALGILLPLMENNDSVEDNFRHVVRDIATCFDVTFSQLWLLNRDKHTLTGAFSAGKNIKFQREYYRISTSSIKIASIVKTEIPIITNDIVNDFKIVNAYWAIKENIKSFVGYPLTYKDQAIGVLEMYSDKDFSPGDLDLAETLCREISKQISKNDSIDFPSLRLHYC